MQENAVLVYNPEDGWLQRPYISNIYQIIVPSRQPMPCLPWSHHPYPIHLNFSLLREVPVTAGHHLARDGQFRQGHTLWLRSEGKPTMYDYDRQYLLYNKDTPSAICSMDNELYFAMLREWYSLSHEPKVSVNANVSLCLAPCSGYSGRIW